MQRGFLALFVSFLVILPVSVGALHATVIPPPATFPISTPPTSSRQTVNPTSAQLQPAALLIQSNAALASSVTVSDITLAGTAESIAGSDDETGSVLLKATAGGQSRIDLSLSAGVRSEVRSVDGGGSPIGVWSGPDGVQHAISYHNLFTDPSWFFPALTVRRLVNITGLLGSYVGLETLNGQSVHHISFAQPPDAAAGANASIIQHLTQIDLYLDPMTLLPVALSFATHPDNNELLDIPVQIQFSGYQNISGVQTPFHIQKFLNGSLSLDLQVQSATLNTGIPASAFGAEITQ
jgi:hypothetical protein